MKVSFENKNGKLLSVSDKDLVLLRLESKYGFFNSWWRVEFIDNDNTFIGKLEKQPWHYNNGNEIGYCETFKVSEIQEVFFDEMQLCYSDNVTICDCKGLCRNK